MYITEMDDVINNTTLKKTKKKKTGGVLLRLICSMKTAALKLILGIIYILIRPMINQLTRHVQKDPCRH